MMKCIFTVLDLQFVKWAEIKRLAIEIKQIVQKPNEIHHSHNNHLEFRIEKQ